MRDGGWKTEAMVARYTEHLRLDESASARLTAIQGRAVPPGFEATQRDKIALSLQALNILSKQP